MPFNWLTNPLCSGHSPLPLLLALTVPLKTHCTHSLIARRIINYTVEIDAKSKSPFKRIWWYATHKLWYHHGARKINIRRQTGKCTYVLVCTCMHICYHSKANTQICTNRQLAIWNIHCSAVQCSVPVVIAMRKSLRGAGDGSHLFACKENRRRGQA